MIMNNNCTKKLNKQAAGKLAGLLGLGLDFSPAAITALSMLPVVAGGSLGYGLTKAKVPDKSDFRNLSAERLLAEIKSQAAYTDRLRELREAREEAEEEGAAGSAQFGQRELRVV